MTDEQLQEMRSRIAEVEDEFSRRANILLDESILTREQADSNTRSIENLVQVTAESRRDIDQLAQRTGELAESISELRLSIEAVNQARRDPTAGVKKEARLEPGTCQNLTLKSNLVGTGGSREAIR